MTTKNYYIDEGAFPVLRGFRDRSTNILEWTTDDGDRMALVIHRQDLPGAPESAADALAAFEGLVDGEVKGYATKFQGLRMEKKGEAVDIALTARAVTFRFRHEEDIVYQHQTFVLLEPRVVVLTAAAKAKHRELVDSVMNDALRGFKAWETE